MARVADIGINVCPAYKVGRLRVVAVMNGSQRLPGPGVVLTPNQQGPPRDALAGASVLDSFEHFARGGGGVALASTSATLAFNLMHTPPARLAAAGGGRWPPAIKVWGRVGVKFGP